MKTMIKLANSNRKICPFHGKILFDGKTARSTNMESHAIIDHGLWNFPTPTVVDVKQLKEAMNLSKGQDWQGDTLNGIKLTNAMPADDFPMLPEYLSELTPIHADNLADSLAKVAPASAKEDIRYYINGVCFDFGMCAMVATNGARLHLVKNAFTSELKGQAIVPRDAIALIGAKHCVAIAFSDKHCRIDHIGGGYVISKLIDGKFPDWQRVIPKESDRPYVVAFGKNQINTCKIIAKAVNASKVLESRVIIDELGQIASAGVTLSFTDTFPMPIELNANYLLDALEAAQEGEIHLAGEYDSMLVRNGDFSAVVMPCGWC